jgi:hypothetical protein
VPDRCRESLNQRSVPPDDVRAERLDLPPVGLLSFVDLVPGQQLGPQVFGRVSVEQLLDGEHPDVQVARFDGSRDFLVHGHREHLEQDADDGGGDVGPVLQLVDEQVLEEGQHLHEEYLERHALVVDRVPVNADLVTPAYQSVDGLQRAGEFSHLARVVHLVRDLAHQLGPVVRVLRLADLA